MARTPITPTALTANAAIAAPAGTAIDATDHHIITGVPLERLVLRVRNTFDGVKTVTVKAGVNPPAVASGLGNLVVSMAGGDPTPTEQWVGPFESGRFAQADGSLHIDVAASMTGTIAAFVLPKSA